MNAKPLLSNDPTKLAGGKNNRAAWLQGGGHRCSQPPTNCALTACRVVVLPQPECENDFELEALCGHLGACLLSANEILRGVRNGNLQSLTPAMQNTQAALPHGGAVHDEAVLNLVGERLGCLKCAGGFVLEGFPRTVAQAKVLEQLLENHGLALTAAIELNSTNDLKSSGVSNRVNPPCRLVKDFYQTRGLLISAAADNAPSEIARQILHAAKNFPGGKLCGDSV